MRVESTFRSATGVSLILVLTAATAVAPYEKPADHDGSAPHLEVAHGGHGQAIDEPDAQIRTELALFAVALPTLATVPAGTDSPTKSIDLRTYLTHLSRDPPAQARPRAPPLL